MGLFLSKYKCKAPPEPLGSGGALRRYGEGKTITIYLFTTLMGLPLM